MLKHYFLGLLLLLTALHSLAQQQNIDSSQLIRLDVENAPLPEVLKLIEEQAGLSFSYSSKSINPNQKVTFRGEKSLEELLEEILSEHRLEFQVVEKQIIIKRKKPDKNKLGTIKGYVTDQNNGEALIGATVLINELADGTLTNAFGYYSISVPEGEYTVVISYLGYEQMQANVSVYGSKDYSLELKEQTALLQEVLVTDKSPLILQQAQMSKDQINVSTVEQMPALFGEMDVVKSLEFIPGVKAHSDGSTFFYVRGGQRDQNLILVDDAPIFNPSHLLGVFSTIIPDVVNTIDIYKGDIPASLGGRLSSVVDIRTKKGNDKKLQFWGSLGLISTKLGLEGPIKKEKSSFLVSARSSRIKWIVDNEENDVDKFNFYDFTLKTNFALGDKDQLYVSAYNGKDNYFVNNAGIEWQNLAGSIRWNHLFGDDIFMNATIAGSTYDYFLHTDISTNTRWKSRIGYFTMKSDFTYFQNTNNVIEFGAALNGYNFNPGNLLTDDPNVSPPIVSIRNAFEAVAYGQHEVKLGEKLGLKYGLRLSSWTNQGAAFEFQLDSNRNPVDTLFFKEGEDYNDFGNLEPRIGLSYFISDNSSIKFNYSRNVQNVHLISNSISPFTSLEVWLPSNLNIQSQIADQVALGYQKYFLKSGLSFSSEAYYKRMQNQIDYEPHAETLLNPLIEGELRFGETRAYGLELLLKKDLGKLRGWLGYTYSRAKRTFEEINNGLEYNAFFDRPHEVNIVLGYDITDRITIGTNWMYYTGAPYSAPIGFFEFNGLEAPIYGEKNNKRLPDYHRLDISATFVLNKSKEARFNHSLALSFYNLYGRKNTLFVNYNKVEDSSGDFRIPDNLLDNNRLTTQVFLFQFTPSLSYNFTFL